MSKFRLWLIKRLVGSSTMGFNLHLLRGLYIDSEKCANSYFYNVNVNINHEIKFTDGVGLYIGKAIVECYKGGDK